MAGRKPKPDVERIAELNDEIERLETKVAKCQAKLAHCREERNRKLSHLIIGEMETRSLNYPDVESLIDTLSRGEVSEKQKEAASLPVPPVTPSPASSDKGYHYLQLEVTDKEREIIRSNMEKAHYKKFSEYARKLLLDGYLIQWTSPETKELRRELGAVNRSLNQLVKRANTTGSIYAGDFLDMLDIWQTIQDKTLHYIDEMSRKTNGLH